MKEEWTWQNGDGPSVQIGYINPNGQRCCGHRGVPGNDHLQFAHKVECEHCGHVYGANGSDLHLRKCSRVSGWTGGDSVLGGGRLGRAW